MKRSLIIAFLFAVGYAQAEVVWNGLTDENYYSGPKLTSKDLAGKVVLVEQWGVNCGPCLASLPHMEKVWETYKSKPFILLGSHLQGRDAARVQALVKQNKLTYPIYQGAGLKGGPWPSGIPHMYVVNHRGKIVYDGGRNDAAVEKAIEAALKEAGGQYCLTAGVNLKYYKALAKQLTFGKPTKSVIKILNKDIKRAESKHADVKAKEMAQEAEAILEAIESAKDGIAADIELLKEKDEKAAAKQQKLFDKTFS